MTHTEAKALKLALEALENELNVDITEAAEVGEAAELMCDAITAIKQALAAQPAVQQGRDWSLLEATQESLREHMAEIKRLKAAQPAPVQPVAYTTGHCEEKAKPRGCQLHNVNCGYPACDRKAVVTPPAAQPAPVQDSTCNETLRAQGKAYPRTCKKCGKGPCIGAPKQPPSAQPAIPDAITDNSESPEYRAGWNDCREVMAEMLRGQP